MFIRILFIRFQIPEIWPYQEARRLFKEPVVTCADQQPDLKWTSPDEEVNDLSVSIKLYLLIFYLFISRFRELSPFW